MFASHRPRDRVREETIWEIEEGFRDPQPTPNPTTKKKNFPVIQYFLAKHTFAYRKTRKYRWVR